MAVLEENKKRVMAEFMEGAVSYIDLSSWTFADRFMAFLMSIDFFEHAVGSYPNPRKKQEDYVTGQVGI